MAPAMTMNAGPALPLTHPAPRMSARIARAMLAGAMLAGASRMAAQPSGGPYGPLAETYAVPAGAAHVYFVSPDGHAEAPGTSLEQPTTIAAAVARVVTGDAIILRGGTGQAPGQVRRRSTHP